MSQRKQIRKSRSRKLRRIHPLSWLLLMLCAAAGVFFIKGGIVTSHKSKEYQAQIQQNLTRIAEAERKNAATYAEKTQEAKSNSIGELDMNEEREYILSLNASEIDNDELAQSLAHTAIVGDSLVEAAAAYNVIDHSIVIAKIGASVFNSEELFEQVKAAHPQVVFLCFGVNDIEIYAENTDAFITDYRTAIEDLKKALPDAVFYVQGLLPPSQSVTDSHYNYRNEYNQKLQELCAELECQYFDSSFLLENRPELYDSDGIHPKKEFYPLWLTYLADIAGLSS